MNIFSAIKQHIQAKRKQGFTFIEMMVSVTVLLVAVVAPMSLAQEGVFASRVAQDQIVAFYLGQEGVEIVKHLRDNNRLAGNAQLDGSITSECLVLDPQTDLGCSVESVPTPTVDQCVGSCDPIKFNGISYSQSETVGYEDTKFTREVKVWVPDAAQPDQAAVEAHVTWVTGNISQEYRVQSFLYNW